MPEVTVRCPDCSRAYSVDASLVGRKGRCKDCGRSFPLSPSQETPDADVASTLGASAADRPQPVSLDARLPERIGRFLVMQHLGSGAFGTVYRATDPLLGREVALKVPRVGLLENPRAAERFLREARAAASLRHPNIVTLFETGFDLGVHYIATEYIDGSTLAEAIGSAGIDPRRAADVTATLAEALQFAHTQGIVHRDVKPANVMMDRDGQPHLMDFGLARIEGTEGERLTQVGAVVGTPAYMAPEQAAEGGVGAGATSDQYSLGVTLYELLTGRTPFSGQPEVVIYSLLHHDRPPPRALNPKVPRDLETICLKATARAPGERYASCRELTDDLRRWLRDEPILARRQGTIEIALHWVRRNRIASGLAASVVAGLVVLGLGKATTTRTPAAVTDAPSGDRAAGIEIPGPAAVMPAPAPEQVASNAEPAPPRPRPGTPGKVAPGIPTLSTEAASVLKKTPEKPKESTSSRRTEAVPDPELTYARRIQQAYRACIDRKLDLAEKFLAGCSVESRSWEWYYCKRLSRFDFETLKGHVGPAYSVAISPDGRRIASGGEDCTVRIWDELKPREALFGHKQPVKCVRFTPDGSGILSISADGALNLWDAATGKIRQPTALLKEDLTAVDISEDGKWIAGGTSKGRIEVWSTDGTPDPAWQHERRRSIQSLAFSPDGQDIVSLTSEGWTLLHRREAKTASVKKRHETVAAIGDKFSRVAVSPDGRYRAAASPDLVTAYDQLMQQTAWSSPANARAVTAVAFSLDGDRLATALEMDPPVWTGDLAASRNGRRAVPGRGGNTIRIRDMKTGEWTTSLQGHPAALNELRFGRDNLRIAAACQDGNIYAWRFDDGLADRSIALRDTAFADGNVAFSGDGRRVCTSRNDNKKEHFSAWDLRDFYHVVTVNRVLAYSGDLSRLAYLDYGSIIIQDIGAGSALRWAPLNFPAVDLPDEFRKDNNRVFQDLAFLEGSRYLLSVSSREEITGTNIPEGQTRVKNGPDPAHKELLVPVYVTFTYFGIWDQVRGGWLVGPLKEPGLSIGGTSLIPGTNKVITISDKAGVRTVNILSPTTLTVEQSFPADYYTVAPNGDLIALFRAGKISIWSTKAGRLVSDGLIDGESCTFDPTGRLIAVGVTTREHRIRQDRRHGKPGRAVATARKQSVKVWDIPGKKLLYDLPVTSAAFSQDGRRVITAEGDGAAIRDALNGKDLILKLPAKCDSMAISPDGRAIAAIGGKTLRVWVADRPETSSRQE